LQFLSQNGTLTPSPTMNELAIDQALQSIFAESSLHARRVLSLTHAVLGAVRAAQAGVANIGRAEALVRKVNPKHAIKQVDRFLSNTGFDVNVALRDVVRFVLGQRWRVTVSLDWTVYEGGDHHRIALNLVTRHGRATPLAWKTVPASQLKNHRNDHEDELLRLFKGLLPKSVKKVTVIADRGFGDVNLYDMLTGELGFDYVIRFRECLTVRDEAGTAKRAAEWVPPNGAARLIPNAKVTGRRFDVAAVVAVKKARMKDPWLLATSLRLSAEEIIAIYAKRFTCEENFRDEKDWRFGMGSRWVKIARADRRDRLCLILALANILLTLLGQAGESLGFDRMLRANTVRRRTHSLFRQGREYLNGALGTVAAAARSLWDRFAALVADQPHVTDEQAWI
jgi:Transposase DDE domain